MSSCVIGKTLVKKILYLCNTCPLSITSEKSTITYIRRFLRHFIIGFEFRYDAAKKIEQETANKILQFKTSLVDKQRLIPEVCVRFKTQYKCVHGLKVILANLVLNEMD